MLHLPILRAGEAYRSLDTTVLRHIVTGEPLARVSQANPGLIAHDALKSADNQRALQREPVEGLLKVCRDAAELYAEGELAVDPVDGVMQTAEDYVRTLSATTGMPHALCRANMEKIRFVLAEMATVLGGLTRGLDLSVFDAGWSSREGRTVAYLRQAQSLGVILPSNSPGVHSLWLPSVPLKVPLVLKPGRQEPWTPMRIAQALIRAGCPPRALSFYPTGYGGAAEILLRSGRSMLFGDESTVRQWRNDPRIQLHGTGWSKVILGEDAAAEWKTYLDVMVASIADNGGRSCLNASGIWLPSHGREVAEAIARRLVEIEPRPLDDPQACVAAFSDPQMAHRISALIDRHLRTPGAEDVTATMRSGERVVEVGGCTFLRPTLIRCDDPQHPLASLELLFPFAAVVERPRAELARSIGSTLVGTVITDDPGFRAEMMDSPHIDRLNLGAIPTSRVSWDQPHEGNLFEHLYRQRAFQAATA